MFEKYYKPIFFDQCRSAIIINLNVQLEQLSLNGFELNSIFPLSLT